MVQLKTTGGFHVVFIIVFDLGGLGVDRVRSQDSGILEINYYGES